MRAKLLCSIPKLLHPYLERYFCVIEHNNYDKQEALAFLRMVRLKERKLEWAFKQKDNGIANKEIYPLLNIKKRRFQQLYTEYKMLLNQFSYRDLSRKFWTILRLITRIIDIYVFRYIWLSANVCQIHISQTKKLYNLPSPYKISLKKRKLLAPQYLYIVTA